MSRDLAFADDHSDQRSFAPRAMPWLMSTIAHAGLLLALAITAALTQTATKPGGQGLDGPVAISTVDSSEQYYEEGTPTGTPDSGGLSGISNTPTPGSPSSDGGPLSDVLGSKSPVDLAGILPGKATIGSAGLEGGGIGTAKNLIGGSGKGNRSLRGGYARTGVFGAQGEGYKFVYVFDRSGSMGGHGGAPLAAAKSQMISSIERLGQTHQFQIIFYNEHPRVFDLTGTPGKLVFGTEQNKKLADRFIGSITADGATAHEEALLLALRMSPDVVFFLTDADEPRMNAQQLAHIARRNHGASINTIEFGYGPQADNDNFLVRLARENGGEHVYVDIGQLPRP